MLKKRNTRRWLFGLIMAATFVGMPVFLIASSGNDYEGLEIDDVRVTTSGTTTRLGFVLDNDGDREVRLTAVAALIADGSGRTLPGSEVQANPNGERRSGLRDLERLDIEVQRRRYIELTQSCDGGSEPQRVRDLRLDYDIFSASQQRDIELPDPVMLPRCSG